VTGHNKKQSVKTRYLSSLTHNILRSGISFITGLLLARWLGVEDYGRMAFLIASFIAFKQFIDLASSQAFYTFLSKRKRSQRFIFYYWCWVGLQFIIALVIVGCILPDSVVNMVWEGESHFLVMLALVAVFMQHIVWASASRMAEAQRETVRVQRLNTVFVIVHLTVVVTLLLIGRLAIPFLFVAMIIEWGVAAWVAFKMYEGATETDLVFGEAEDTVSTVWKEFWVYCWPFIPYACFGFMHDLADRWMLQHWGGAEEQAYFAVARQFSLVVLLAVSSILNIFWKEVAEAHQNGDSEKVKYFFLRATKGIYFFSAFVVGGVLPWTKEIILLSVGEAYVGAETAMVLMFLYPVHQCLGQLSGSLLLATGETSLQVKMGLVFMSVSMVMAYFVLAPLNAVVPGLGLASLGLSLKLVILQIVQVNIWLLVIAKLFHWRYEWGYQIVGLGVLVGVGWMIKVIVLFFLGTLPVIIPIVTASILYLIIAVLVLFWIPWVAGSSRDELRREALLIRRKFS